MLRDGQPRSQRKIFEAVDLPKRAVRTALERGVNEGWLLMTEGPRRAKLYRINFGVAPLLRRTPSSTPDRPARRPFDAYDGRRVRVLPRVLELIVALNSGVVLKAYAQAWRECGGVEPYPRDERDLWSELSTVMADLVEPVLRLVEEYELLPAPEHCLTVGALRRERVRDFGPAECEPCGQVHHLRQPS